ncbi:MAG: tyrosine-type recombinase/integrase [Bacteriovoracaceae bacterium]
MNSTTFNEKMDFNHLEHKFYNSLESQGKSFNTLKNYKTDLTCFKSYLQNKQGNLSLNDFNFVKVTEYGQFLDQKYESDNSKRRRVQALRLFFDFLIKENLYEENPIKKLPTSPKFLDVPRPTPFSDLVTLWKYLCLNVQNAKGLEGLLYERNQLVFLFIFGGALKVSDLSELKMEDVLVDHESKSIRVLIRPRKRDPYTIPMPSLVYEVFKNYIANLQKEKEKSSLVFDHVLFNANPYRILAGGLSPRGLEIIFEELREKLKITLTPRSLRQSGIFNWLHKQIDEVNIKEWMGVAPSYSLKLYRDHQSNHYFKEEVLWEIFKTPQMDIPVSNTIV